MPDILKRFVVRYRINRLHIMTWDVWALNSGAAKELTRDLFTPHFGDIEVLSVTIMTTTEVFASASWNVHDIKACRPSWSTEQAEEFLQENEEHIRDRMIEAGWSAIDHLLAYDPPDL